MKEVKGDIWDKHEEGFFVVVTTNGVLRKNGDAVMGKGIAKQAAERFPGIESVLGARIEQYGNIVQVFPNHHLITFPTKHDWRDDSDERLIINSARDLDSIYDVMLEHFNIDLGPIYLPHVGCENGGLKWRDVKKIMREILYDESKYRFIHDGRDHA